MDKGYIELLMENGEIAVIHFDNKHLDEVYDTIRTSMKIGETWSAMRFDKTDIKYLGHSLESLNMGKAVGFL